MSFLPCLPSDRGARAVRAGHAELHEHQQLLHVRKVRGIAGSHVLNSAAADAALDVRFSPELDRERAPGERELISRLGHADTAESTGTSTTTKEQYRLILTG